MSEWQYHNNLPEDIRIRKAAKELVEAYADKQIRQEGTTDEDRKQDIRKDIHREILNCNGKILNLPYANLEEQSAVVAMLSEHTYMQVMKGREGEMNAEEINWLVDEMQDS